MQKPPHAAAPPSPRRRKAFAAMAASMLCLSFTALLARKLSFTLPPMQTAALHNLVILLIFGGKCLLSPPPPPKEWRLYWLRGLVGVTSMACMFAALHFMNVQTVLAFALLSPVLSAPVAAKVFGERLRPKELAATGAGLCGALLVIRPWDNAEAPDPRGAALMLISACCAAVAGTLIKRASERDGPRTTVSVSALFAAALMLPVSLLGEWRPVPDEAIPLLAGVGLASAGGQYFLALALSLEKINTLITLDFLRLLFGALLAWAYLGETPGALAFAGGAVIAASSVCAVRLKEAQT